MSDLFGVHESAVKLHNRNITLIAENIANANTPGFKAKGIDFKSVLRGGSGGLKLTGTDSNHMSSTRRIDEKYIVPYGASLDGNTVEVESEKVKLMETQHRVSTSLEFISGAVKTRLQMIKGN